MAHSINLIALVFILHPLLPKLTFVLVWIACSWYLLGKISYRIKGKGIMVDILVYRSSFQPILLDIRCDVWII